LNFVQKEKDLFISPNELKKEGAKRKPLFGCLSKKIPLTNPMPDQDRRLGGTDLSLF